MAASITLEAVSKRYRIYHQRHQTLKEIVLKFGRGRWEDLWALREVTAAIHPGETVGVIGENGSGKSTLLKLLANILQPDAGRVAVAGRVSSILELGTSFQMEYSGRENIFLYGTILGLRRREVERRFDEIVRFSELESFIDNPVKNYSSGMYMRLAFAIAVQVDPDVLLVDEVLAVGDEAFQRKCYARMAEFKKGSRTVVLVSHDMAAIRRFCDRVLWIDRGRLAGDGTPEDVTRQYLETTSQRIAASDYGDTGPALPEFPGVGRITGQVRLRSVRLLDAEGTERNVFRAGERVKVELGLYSYIRSATVAWTVSVFRSDGLHCMDLSATAAELEYDLVPGNAAVSVDISRFPFREGDYELNVRIFDKLTNTTYDYRHRDHRFRIEGEGVPGPLVDIHYPWSVERPAVEEPDRNPAIGM